MRKLLARLPAMRAVSRRDGWLALAVLALYGVEMYVSLRLIPLNDWYHPIQIAHEAVLMLLLVLLVRLRGQGLVSLGLSRQSAAPLAAIAVCTAVVGVQTLREGNWSPLVRWLFFLIAVGGMEELLFRGFAYPRIAKRFGHAASLVLCGLLFGAMHHIAPMVWQGAPWQGVFSHLLGTGLLGNLLFLLLYAATGNLLDAILLHAALDYASYSPLPLVLCGVYLIGLLVFRYARAQKKEAA